MGTTVRLLDDTLVDQIAAGEVIERPANLVKELLENALDAGARAITVSVEDGGRSQVRVSDDGVGMSTEDATLAIERHATSKIRSFDDLLRVRTLGFRGEALPSIGSVSRMTITTRPKANLEGTRLRVEGGALIEASPVGCPPGTSVEVADLFYNVPARRKFLRARQTESSRIFEVCQRVALSHPELRLTVTSDGRTARRYLPASDLAERAAQIFADAPLQRIHAERDSVSLDAVFAPIESARPGARQLFLLVNGRPVLDRGLARAIAFAFGERLPPGHYPRGVVSIELAPEDVDVNAHPQKTEVRFRQAAQLLDRVTRMLAAHLPSTSPGDRYWDARLGGPGPRDQPERGETPRVSETRTAYAAPSPNELRFIAQARDEVIVCEGAEALVVLDRARADAVRRYDLLRSGVDADRVPRQNLLFPDRVELPKRLQAALATHAPTLEAIGFDWSDLGPGSYVVRSVPAAIGDVRGATSFERAIDAASAAGNAPIEAVLRALAEASAIARGQVLDTDAAMLIVAAIQPSNPDHETCIVARIPLSAPQGAHD